MPACRATLSDSDESGIAFFDDRLVDEQNGLTRFRRRRKGAQANEEFQVYYQPKV